MMQKLFRTATLLVGVMSGLLFALPAWSQPEHGFRHGLMGTLEQVKEQLNLTTSQQVQWDSALAQTKAAHDVMRQNHQQMKQLVQSELAKAEPDLAAVAALHDSIQQANIAARKQARAGWLQLYATFSTEQKTVVKNVMLAKLQRMEKFRHHMKERFGANG